MTEGPRLIGRSAAAAYLGISPSTFSNWVAAGKMPQPILGTRKWDKKAIDARLDEISGLVTTNNSGETDLQKWRREQESSRRRQRTDPPRHGLNKRAGEILMAMSYNTELKTMDVLPGAGPITMRALAAKKLLLANSNGEYLITEEGHAEAVRIMAQIMER